jgi:ABC-type multidrug transport system fused ATPase/permease subunit
LIKNLFSILSHKEKICFVLILFVFIFFSILDLIGLYFFSVGISGLLNPNNFNDLINNLFIFNLIEVYNLVNISISNFYLFLLFYFILKNLFFYLFYNLQAKFIADISSNIANLLFKYFLLLPYEIFIKLNFSENSKNLTYDVSRSIQLISGINNFFKEITLILLIVFFIFFLNIKFFFLISFFILLLLLVFRTAYSKKIKFYGNQNQLYVGKQLKRILDSFNLFIEIKIYRLLDFFSNKFKHESYLKEFTEQKSNIIVNTPRLIIEIFVVFLLFLLISIFEVDNLNVEIFKYSFLLVLTLRLIPSIISFNRTLFDIKLYNISLKIFLGKLRRYKYYQERNKKNILDFKKNIYFKNITFGYSKNNNVIENINLKINKYETIGIIGASGSGKTTLILLLLGLLKPRSGKILVDNVNLGNEYSLQNQISYAPQETILVNDSIIKNITFKDDLFKNELNRLNKSIRVSQSKNFLKKNYFNKVVEEKGMNFSGGQKKRIGLARALFFEKNIYIFDEPTNFLDIATAKNFINNIKKFLFNKTVIIITHDKSILNNCDKVFILKNKKLSLVKKNKI